MAEKKGPKHNLDKLVDAISPKKINEKMEPHKKAHNGYKLGKTDVADHDEFVKEIKAYVKHHFKSTDKADLSDDDAYSKARRLLESEFKDEGGYVGAYRKARDGDMKEVIRALAHGAQADAADSYVEHTMSQIDPLDFDAHVEIARQYIGKFKGLVSGDLKTKSPEQLAHNYQGLIRHLQSVKQSAESNLKKYEPKKAPAKKKAA